MEGILEEGTEHLEETVEPLADATIVASAQKVEHYEMAAYGALCTLAEQLEEHEAKRVLSEILGEEQEASAQLERLASPVVVAGQRAEQGNGAGRARSGNGRSASKK
jgi:ferritin-like metal-binding protein YciE